MAYLGHMKKATHYQGLVGQVLQGVAAFNRAGGSLFEWHNTSLRVVRGLSEDQQKGRWWQLEGRLHGLARTYTQQLQQLTAPEQAGLRQALSSQQPPLEAALAQVTALSDVLDGPAGPTTLGYEFIEAYQAALAAVNDAATSGQPIEAYLQAALRMLLQYFIDHN